jgi:hypothetical protein
MMPHEPNLPRHLTRLDILIGCDAVQAVVLRSGYIVRIVGHPEEGAPDSHMACGCSDPKTGTSCTRMLNHRGAHVACEIETPPRSYVDTPRLGIIFAVWR